MTNTTNKIYEINYRLKGIEEGNDFIQATSKTQAKKIFKTKILNGYGSFIANTCLTFKGINPIDINAYRIEGERTNIMKSINN